MIGSPFKRGPLPPTSNHPAPSGAEMMVMKYLAPLVEGWANKAGVDVPSAIKTVVDVAELVHAIDARLIRIELMLDTLVREGVPRDRTIAISADGTGPARNGNASGYADINREGIDQ